jgi:hypothetical protein
MSDLQKVVAFKANIGRHLTQLSRLTGTIVNKDSLLSPQETEALRATSKTTEYAPVWRHTMDFSKLTEAQFQRFVGALDEMSPSGVYIWTPLSNVCGLLRPVPLKSIQWGFDFDLIPEGILVLLTADLADRMLLDFSEGSTRRQELEIEVSGQHWGRTSL